MWFPAQQQQQRHLAELVGGAESWARPTPAGQNVGDSQGFPIPVNVREVLLWPVMGKLLNLPIKDWNYGLFLDNGRYHADVKTACHT